MDGLCEARDQYGGICAPGKDKDEAAYVYLKLYTGGARKGKFTEILNSDDVKYGGQGRINAKPVTAKIKKPLPKTGAGKAPAPASKTPEYEIECYLPPLSVVVLEYNYSD